MDGKRILLISHYLGVSGAPISLLRHAKYMKEAGYTVDVWSIDYYRGNELEPEFLAAGLNVRHVKNEEGEIVCAIHKEDAQYDLVVCNTICTYKCIRVFQRLGVPTIWFVRETVLADKWAIHNIEFCNLFKHFYNIYCPAEYAASQIRFFNKHIHVVRNAIADSFSGYAPVTGFVRFGYIGSIRPVKGVDVLVDAFLGVCDQRRGNTLCIAGKIDSQYARELVAKTQGNSAIEWIGEIRGADKHRFFDGIDILCVPSLEEPFGLTAAEGAMYGKVVITTDRTGANCFVDGIKGVMVRAGSVIALKQAMSRLLLLDSDELRRLQEISRANYLKYGTMDHEREAVLKMVSDNIGKCPPPQKRHMFDKILLGRSLPSKIGRRIRRSYLNFALMLVGRGDWNKRAARCT